MNVFVYMDVTIICFNGKWKLKLAFPYCYKFISNVPILLEDYYYTSVCSFNRLNSFWIKTRKPLLYVK
jgi:hypothetical protein